jgi:hypothetical protein
MSRTGRNFLTPGVMNGADHSPEREESSIAVAVTGMRSVWRLRIFAEGQEGPQKTGLMYVGSVRTLPWNGGDRVVAFACCPGAVRWFVDGQPEDHTVREEPCIRFMGAPCCFVPGVSAVDGVSLPAAHHYRKVTGVSGAVVPAGPVVSWTAEAGAVDATVSILQPGDTVPTVVTIPAGGTYSEADDGGTSESTSFTFANTVSFVITYEVGGDGLDAF